MKKSEIPNIPRNIKEYFAYLWRYSPRSWCLFLFQDAVHFCRYPIAFIFVGRAIDLFVGRAAEQGVPKEAWLYTLGVFGILLLGEAMHIWTGFIAVKWKQALRKYIRSDFFKYTLGHSNAYFHNRFAGSIARKVSEVAEASLRLHDLLRYNLFGASVSLVCTVIAMLIISPIYGGILALFLLLITGSVLVLIGEVVRRSREFADIRSGVSGTIVDMFTNISAIKSNAAQDYEIEVHAENSDIEAESAARRVILLVWIDNIRRIGFVSLSTMMMVALIIGWKHEIVSIGDMSAIMGQSFALVGAVWMLGYGIIGLADELGNVDDAIRTLTPEHTVTDSADATVLFVPNGKIDFRQVEFSYPNQPVFDKLDFEIKAGQKLGLVGPSGAGKSSLINILMRSYDVQGGAIEIDGQDISRVEQQSLASQIAVIPQDTILFHRSLMENIRYGRADACDEDVIEASKKAFAHDFIQQLPEGYNTLVGERGVKLSGGQRQRIAIARAILKDAPILILDEATSALDSESEQLIQESFKTLMEGKTVIAIAHRLSTISHLDRLIVMEEGKIIEDGGHKALLDKKGLYAKLWSMQSGGFLGE